jgi:acetyl-CoA acetyltransferase
MPVYVAGWGLQSGAVTDRPTVDLQAMLSQAAAEAIAGVQAPIDAVLFGTMALDRGRGGLDSAHLPDAVAHALDLPATDLLTLTGTSESGALAFVEAVRGLRAGRWRTVLVLAGEAMFQPGGDRAAAVASARALIAGMLTPEERALGLSMLPVGDLLLDHVLWRWPSVAELLIPVALDKARRAHSWRRGFLAGKRDQLDAATYADLLHNPWVARHLRRRDVCPNANGATALVLTSDPRIGGDIEVRGIGAGRAAPSLQARAAPLDRPAALEQALDQLCADAGLTRATLRRGAGVLHDPFPSIELLTLHALGGWPWACEAFAAGWGHPLGGLPGVGHALGNTGLAAMVQAAAWLASDERLIDLSRAPSPPRHVLVTSVGSPFTRVLAAVFARRGEEWCLQPDSPLPASPPIAPSTVLAATPVPGGWLHAVQQGPTLAWRLAGTPWPTGSQCPALATPTPTS